MSDIIRKTVTTYHAGRALTVILEIQIDMDAVASKLARAAVCNKTRRTAFMGGAIRGVITGGDK